MFVILVIHSVVYHVIYHFAYFFADANVSIIICTSLLVEILANIISMSSVNKEKECIYFKSVVILCKCKKLRNLYDKSALQHHIYDLRLKSYFLKYER